MLNIYLKFGSYSAPSTLTLILVGVTIIHRREIRSLLSLQLATKDILLVNSSGKGSIETLNSIREIAQSQTEFPKTSAYIDAYCLGRCSEPRSEFIRVGDSGYQKSTSDDQIVRVAEKRGLKMLRSIESGKPLMESGPDGCTYLILPIGNHACVNFSESSEMSPMHIAEESRRALEHLSVALTPFETRLTYDASSSRMPINSIRSIRGNGIWREQFGAIFIDVVDFSSGVSGIDKSATQFVGSVLVPAMIKYMQPYAAAESTRGDEVYFAVIHDLHSKGGSIDRAFLTAIRHLHEFVFVESDEICRKSGFTPVSYRIGCAMGTGTVEANDFEVKTYDDFVTIASRCQSAAKPGETLIDSSTARRIGSRLLPVEDERTYLVKKTVFKAARVLRLHVDVEGAS